MSRPLFSQRRSALTGRVRVPGDKSLSHRSLIFAALAIGQTRISGLLEGEDVIRTAEVLKALGVRIERDGADWIVTGAGPGGLRQPDTDLDFGNSGTGIRLMMGVIAGHPIRCTLTGDASLQSRPMARVLTPLKDMGVQVDGETSDRLPLTITGSTELRPITYTLPVASAQVKSAILLAGLMTAGTTTVIEPKATRDHTERMLTFFGGVIGKSDHAEGTAYSIEGGQVLKGRDVIVPGDPSSAAFLVAAATIVPGSDLVIENVLQNPTRTGFFETLSDMGADIQYENRREMGGEEVADMRVRHASLNGIVVPAERAPSMIDEYPVLAAIASYATGETRMTGLDELRVKESDRLAATQAGLIAVGADAEIDGDDLIVRGTGALEGGGPVTTHMDHRIAMAFLTAGLNSERPVRVDDGTFIATSFPGFSALMTRIGGDIRAEINSAEDACGPLVIAVDGPAASGKGTLARRIADELKLAYLDTGLLYRAVAHRALAENVPLDEAEKLSEIARTLDLTNLDDPALRDAGVGNAASRVAAIAEVRATLMDLQRSFSSRKSGAILDGRDIGTVVCPNAHVKIYVTASAAERARRRHKERLPTEPDLTYDEVLEDIRRRDARDTNRAISPMLPAEDAHLLETTDLDIEGAYKQALELIESVGAERDKTG